jgi:hypothetical protein
VGQVPVEPDVTSLKFPECVYGRELASVVELPVLPDSAYMAAIRGEDRLVPPYWDHVEAVLLLGAYTDKPVCGSATAETSAEARLLHPVPKAAAAGSAALTLEHPDPEPDQAVSPHPRALVFLTSDVPPTAVT